MAEVIEAAWLAVGLLLHPDAGLLRIVGLSLGVSLAATVLAALLGLPMGAVLAVYPFDGRRALVLLVNALLGLPSVVVGLALYLLLSRAGPFGGLGLLFTPAAMVAAQAVLALPEVGAILMVGGNIAGYTRTMTTAITLETGQGHLAYAMALGVMLVALSVAVSSAAFLLSDRARGPARGVG